MTHGGLPEARHWDDDTRQQLGQVVFMVCAGSQEKARQGYIKFYQLKRLFNAVEFDQFVEELDEWRKKKGFKSLSLIIKEIGDQMTKHGQVIDIDEHPTEVPPVPMVKRYEVITPRLPIIHHEVEQMSLF
jgi:hypothetical protein